MKPVNSLEYNSICTARMAYESQLTQILHAAGWKLEHRKQNNFWFWSKQFPEGRVTAMTPEDALKWEYEL